MSSSVFVIGANGYIGRGVALAFRRAGYRVYGLIRNEQHSNDLLKNEIEPLVADKFDDLQPFTDILASCSIIVDAVGYKAKLSVSLLEAAVQLGKTQTQNGKLPHYAPLYIFTSGIMTYGDTSTTGRRPVDETVKPRNPPVPEASAESSSSNVTAMKDREDFEDQVLITSSAALKTTVVRPGFVYGGQGGFVADLFNSEPLVFQGRRDMRWSWVHVDDLGEGYVAIGRAPRVVVDKQLYNLVAPNDNPTYEELRLAMAKAQGRTEKIVYKEAEPNVPTRWDTDSIINPAKAINELGWKPRHVGFVEEIDTYYKSWAAHKTVQETTSSSNAKSH
jgi:UDP-glucose 4-epimerase